MLDQEGFLIFKNSISVDSTTSAKRLLSSDPIEEFKDNELIRVPVGEVFVFDVETYPNFFYVAFKHLKSGKFVTFELSADFPKLQIDKLNWLLFNFCLVGFNSTNYDLPMITAALEGRNNQELKDISDSIIENSLKHFQFERDFKLKIPKAINHIDLIEVAPLEGSLKLYAGRLHCKRMQDLPFQPNHFLTQEEAKVVRPYCCNDLENTELLFKELAGEINLRSEMSQQYKIDLRSKSDAQIAEAVIGSQLSKILGYWPRKPSFAKDLKIKYNKPDFIKFKTEYLNNVLSKVLNFEFELDGNGAPIMPEELAKLVIRINKTNYKLGMGGLHSQESCISHKYTDDWVLSDDDVASYYPRIILNQKLSPDHLGNAFLEVYSKIVSDRISAKNGSALAKKEGDRKRAKHLKGIADSLKIVINGLFGKFGNKYSLVYSPQLLLQVTITGQLALLMLIEKFELSGFVEVVSANTDGVVSLYKKQDNEKVRALIKEWEQETDFETEQSTYKSVYSRDVNSYIALKQGSEDPEAKYLDEKLGFKTKGAFCERGSALNSRLSKNPESLVSIDAVLYFLKHRIPLEETIRNCKDIRRFVSVRNVRGGGQKDGLYLGKVVRYYYSKNNFTAIHYVKSGNKVAKSDGAKPCMDLPDEFPTDIDYEKYIKISEEILDNIGFGKKDQTDLFM